MAFEVGDIVERVEMVYCHNKMLVGERDEIVALTNYGHQLTLKKFGQGHDAKRFKLIKKKETVMMDPETAVQPLSPKEIALAVHHRVLTEEAVKGAIEVFEEAIVKSVEPEKKKMGPKPKVVNRIKGLVGMDKELQSIRKGVEHNLPILMIGETGVGKTYTILQVAAETKKNVTRISLNGEVGITEILGKFTLKDGNTIWQDGVLVSAMRKGHWVVLDELNAALPEVLFCLNSLMDDSRSICLAEKDGEVVKPHKDFRIFATINPCDSYVGTKEINPALMSRFPIILWVNYPSPVNELEIIVTQTPINRELGKVLVDVVNDIRHAKHTGSVSCAIGVRDTVNWAKVFALCGMTLSEAFEVAVLNKARRDEHTKLAEIAKHASALKVDWKAGHATLAKKFTFAEPGKADEKLKARNAILQATLKTLQKELKSSEV